MSDEYYQSPVEVFSESPRIFTIRLENKDDITNSLAERFWNECRKCKNRINPEFSRIRNRIEIDGVVYKYYRMSWCDDCMEKYHKGVFNRKRTRSGFYSAGELYGRTKNNARQKGIDFNLDRTWFELRYNLGICEYTGLRFCLEKKGKIPSPLSPSIDRISPAKGYTKDNCVMCCWAINLLKYQWEMSEVIPLVKALIDKSNKPK